MSSKFNSKFNKLKKDNKKKLCRYFTLIYPEPYASSVVGEKCKLD